MGKHSLHSTLAAQAIWLGLVALVAGGGCWEEIEYTGPDPSTVDRRPSRLAAKSEPAPPTTEAVANPVDDSVPQVPPPAELEPPVAATEAAGSQSLSTAEDAAEPEAAEELAASDNLFDDVESEQTPAAEVETSTTPPPSEPPPPAINTRLAAWQLGSKLTLAAIAHDRGLVPDDAAKWFAEARAAADVLGTTVAELPEPAAASEVDGGSRGVHDYLFQQGQRIWRELTDRHGADHAALFEVAVKSNVLLVLYQPGSAAVDALAGSIREASPQAELPADLWRPLLDTLTNQSPVAKVRLVVRRLHADVEQHLAGPAEQR